MRLDFYVYPCFDFTITYESFWIELLFVREETKGLKQSFITEPETKKLAAHSRKNNTKRDWTSQ